MNNKQELPLHKVTHFRRMREVLIKLAKEENINIKNYNLNNIRCYRENGHALNGNNVTFASIPTNRSYFVSDNEYEIYEIPNTRNNPVYEGNFLFLAYNKSFNYYLFGSLSYNVKSVKANGQLDDHAYFKLFGTYDIINCDTKDVTIRKRSNGKVDWGDKFKNSSIFDVRSVRLTSGYGSSYKDIVTYHTGKTTSTSLIKGNEQVKIYKNKKK